MKRPLHIFIYLPLLSVLVLSPRYILAEEVSSKEKAENLLIQKLKNEKQYNKMKCVFVMEEEAKEVGYFFALREKHDKDCGGDPDVAPIIDRFKVSKKGKIFKYNPLEDEYQPYLNKK